MPTSQYLDQEIEDMYEQIEEIINEEKTRACVILLGYWNAVVRKGEETGNEGKYDLGRRNDKGDTLVEFCRRNELLVGKHGFNTIKEEFTLGRAHKTKINIK